MWKVYHKSSGMVLGVFSSETQAHEYFNSIWHAGDPVLADLDFARCD